MKSFLDFLNEATIKGNTGVPGEGPGGKDELPYLSGIEEVGRRKAQGDPRQIGGRMMQLMDLNRSLIRGKEEEIEKFAEELIKDVYSGFMDSVELDLQIVRDGNAVKQFMDEENKKKEERNKKEKEQKKEPTTKKSDDANLRLEIDKRKLANAITQGEAKNTKEVIRMPECLDGLKKILGDRNGEQLHRQLLEMTELADKMDWIIPVQAKADMMERMPQGMAGACSVDWEDDEEDKEEEKEDVAQNVLDELQNKEEGDDLNQMSDDLKELMSSGKPVIRARGIDFVMLIHEAVKGIYELITSRGIPSDETLASNVFLNTETFEDEAEDFRYGPHIAADLRDFINANKKTESYPNVREFVFGKMMEIPAEEFLKLMKSILMNTPEARTQVDRLIDEVVDELEEYEKEMSDYEMRQRFDQPEEKEQTPEESEVPPVPAGEEEDDIERLKRLSAERESDYDSMTPRQINDLIDQALDEGDFERVKMLSGYLPKESAEIWLREVHRINEMRSHKR
jgi:hypothetical protein